MSREVSSPTMDDNRRSESVCYFQFEKSRCHDVTMS
jgi:hypothetical protein